MTKKPTLSETDVERILGAVASDSQAEFEKLSADASYSSARDAAIQQAVAAFSTHAHSTRSASEDRPNQSLLGILSGFSQARNALWSFRTMSGAAFACTLLFAVSLAGRDSADTPKLPRGATEPSQQTLGEPVQVSEVPLASDGGSALGVGESLPADESLLGSVDPGLDDAVEARRADVFSSPEPIASLDLSDVELAFEDGFDSQDLAGVGAVSDEELFLMEEYVDEVPIV